MSDQDKLTVHFIVSKLVILAVPILNQILSCIGITVNTSNSTADSMANLLCIGIGLAYSYWTKEQAKAVHTNAGFNAGLAAGVSSPSTTTQEPKP